jgi:multiple sugar transport system substrate-binding protein
MPIPRRRFLSLTGGLAAVVGLSACGSNTGRPGPGASGSAGGEKPALSQWYHEYGEDGVQEAVQRYAAAYPDATVTVKWNPGDYDKLVSAALLTADVPDVFEYGNGPTLDMIKAGQVLDLTEVLGDAASQFSRPVLDAVSWDGKVYAIPQTVDMQMLYYRKSALEKAGVAPPATMEELIAATSEVTTGDTGGFFAGNDSGIGVLGQVLIWASGGEQLNAERTGIGFDNAAGHQALASYAKLRGADGFVSSASADWFAADPLVNGETAMQWSGLWILPDVQAGLGDDFGVLPFPRIGSGGRPAVPFGAFSACVAAKGANPDAAKAFVKWLWVDQEEFQVDFSNSYGTHIPAKPGLVARADKIAEGPGKEAATFVDQLGHAPDKLWTPAMGQALTAALTNVATKDADPQAEVAKIASKAEDEIKRVSG